MNKQQREHALVERILDAAEAYDIAGSAEWEKLAVLSENTRLDGLRADADGLIIRGKRFEGLMNVYIVRKYVTEEKFEEGDSFPATYKGHLDERGEPVIETVDVNTRSFYIGTEFEY